MNGDQQKNVSHLAKKKSKHAIRFVTNFIRVEAEGLGLIVAVIALCAAVFFGKA